MFLPLHSPNRPELSFRTVLALPKASSTVLLISSTSSVCLAAAAVAALEVDEGDSNDTWRDTAAFRRKMVAATTLQ